MSDKKLWTIISMGLSTATALLAREGLKRMWRRNKGEDPPINPASPTTTWPDAVAWTAATGLVLGVTKLLVKRGAANWWGEVKGEMPREV